MACCRSASSSGVISFARLQEQIDERVRAVALEEIAEEQLLRADAGNLRDGLDQRRIGDLQVGGEAGVVNLRLLNFQEQPPVERVGQPGSLCRYIVVDDPAVERQNHLIIVVRVVERRPRMRRGIDVEHLMLIAVRRVFNRLTVERVDDCAACFCQIGCIEDKKVLVIVHVGERQQVSAVADGADARDIDGLTKIIVSAQCVQNLPQRHGVLRQVARHADAVLDPQIEGGRGSGERCADAHRYGAVGFGDPELAFVAGFIQRRQRKDRRIARDAEIARRQRLRIAHGRSSGIAVLRLRAEPKNASQQHAQKWFNHAIHHNKPRFKRRRWESAATA